jgi:hypothetical protein
MRRSTDTSAATTRKIADRSELPSWELVEFTPHVGEEIDWDAGRAKGLAVTPKTKTPQSGDCGVFDLVAGTGFEPVTFRL